MRKNWIPLLLALGGGAVGFGLRKWQLATGFEPGTGLAVPGAPSALALAAWAVIVALAVVALCWPIQDQMAWDRAFSAGRQSTVMVTALVLAAALLLVAGVIEAMDLPAVMAAQAALTVSESPIARGASLALPPLRIFLSIASAPCLFFWGESIYNVGEKGKENLGLLVVCLLYCVWLISDYQRRAADPVIWDYVYEVLAIVFTLMGLYYISGYSFQIGKPRRTLFFCLMGSFFSLVNLADPHSLADLFRGGASALFLATHAALILEQPPAPIQPAELETEADDHA